MSKYTQWDGCKALLINLALGSSPKDMGLVGLVGLVRFPHVHTRIRDSHQLTCNVMLCFQPQVFCAEPQEQCDVLF